MYYVCIDVYCTFVHLYCTFVSSKYGCPKKVCTFSFDTGKKYELETSRYLYTCLSGLQNMFSSLLQTVKVQASYSLIFQNLQVLYIDIH